VKEEIKDEVVRTCARPDALYNCTVLVAEGLIEMHAPCLFWFPFSEIPTVTVIEIPNKATCPLCSGVSSDCPLSTNPAYLYAHPPPGE
jgi:hypothetical protein